MNLKRSALFVVFFAAVCTGGYAQTKDQTITIVVKPAQTVEERVSDSLKEKELRAEGEDKLAAEASARIAQKSPRFLLAHAQTVFVQTNTSYFEAVQLQNALRKRSEFDTLELALIDGYDKRNVADMIVEVDRPLFTFTFTYKITARNGILLTSGKVNAWDGNAAAPQLAKRIMEDIKKARGVDTKEKK